MTLSAHTSAAIYISTKVANPLLAFILGIVSHFILDIIPHGDENIGQHITDESARLRYFVKTAALDAFLSLCLVFIFLQSKLNINHGALSSAVIGAWLPDVLWASVQVFRVKWLDWFCRLHSKIHDILGVKLPFKVGVVIQLVFILAMLKLSL
ncbi:MAG: hypothetical protein WC465_04090 [Patescibacteria group bacterium]